MRAAPAHDSPRAAFVAINAIGGASVLASYALWLSNPSNDPGALWGAIDGWLRALYTASMLLATAGYFPFTLYLLRRDPNRVPFARVNALFALVVFPSALWTPLAFEYLDAPSDALWWTMRADLLVVGLASVGIVVTVAQLGPPSRARTLALWGAIAFTFQTLVLDALLWPLLFPR